MTIKLTIRAMVLALATTLSVAAYARAEAPKHVDISAGDLSQALLRLSKQYGADLVYRPEQVYGLKTHGAHGEFTTEQAVAQLLQGTPLELRTDSSGAILIALPIVGAGRVSEIPQASNGTRDVSQDSKGGRKSSSGDFRVAHVDQGANSQSSPVSSNSAAAPAASPAAKDETVQLPQFTVWGTPPDPYRATDVTSVSRIAGSIVDAPFTVNVVTSEFMKDLGANTGYDVDRYFAGVSAGRGAGIEGIQDRQDLRGFESTTRQIDNFGSGSFQANFDPAFIERQELVMGPDTILSPTGTPGGSINVITKSPLFTANTWLSAEVGNINAGKYTIDTTGPITNDLAYRVILSDQDTPTYIPGSFRQISVGAMLTYKFWKAQLTVKYFYEDWRQRGEAANANDWGEMVYEPGTVNTRISATTPEPGFGMQSWNGSSTWSQRNDTPQFGEVEFTMPLFDVVNMRLAANVLNDIFTQNTSYPSVSPSVTYNPVTGYAIAIKLPSTFNLMAMPVVGQYSHSDTRYIQVQNDYTASFKLKWITITPVAGWIYDQSHGFYGYSAQDTLASDLPPVDLLANNGAQVSEKPPLSDYIHSPSNSPYYTIQKQVYALSKFAFFDERAFITTGVSRLWIDTVNYRTTFTTPDGESLPQFVGPYSAAALDSHKDTYLAGAVVKPTTNTSIYYSFSTNAALTSFSPVAGVAEPLWQTGKQYEVGLKGQFFDGRFQISADHFAITQSNLTTPNPLFNIDTSQPTFLLTDVTSKGYELNVVGGITRDLSIIASATDQKYRDAFGRRVRNVPDHLANLLLNYHWHRGLLTGASVFAGVVHEGDVAGETVTGSTSKGVPEQPSFYVPGWTVVSAGAGYTYDRYTLNLNVDNLLNRHFFWDPASRLSVPMYDGRTVRATFAAKF
jgi:iron complex outermembrane recepter protein